MHIAIIGTIANSLLGFRASIIKKLVDEGHNVYALAMDYDPSTMAAVKAMGATPVMYSMSRFGLNPVVDIFCTFKLSRILRTLNVDAVFCYFAKPVIFGSFAAKLAGVPKLIGMLEGLGYTFTVQPEGESLRQNCIKTVQIFLYKLSIPLLSRLIVLNPDDKKDLIDRYAIKAREVSVLGGIGLELDQYGYVPVPTGDEVNFTFIGRLLKEKGIEDFLSAAQLVKQTFPNVTFTVLGTIEPESASSVSLAKLEALTSEGIVQYPGAVTNIPHWLAKCSVFVLPSYYREGVPRSTQEAMAVGRPVITTDVPGCRETVEHGRNGLLIPPHDIQALVDAMSYFVQNPQQIPVMGLESHKIAVEKFDATVVNERLFRLIVDD